MNLWIKKEQNIFALFRRSAPQFQVTAEFERKVSGEDFCVKRKFKTEWMFSSMTIQATAGRSYKNITDEHIFNYPAYSSCGTSSSSLQW